MKKALICLVMCMFSPFINAAEVTIEACASATVTEQIPAGFLEGFPEQCIKLTGEVSAEGNRVLKAKSDSETLSFAFGGCNHTGSDVEVTMVHRWRYSIVTDVEATGRVNAVVDYTIAPSAYSEGSGTFESIESYTAENSWCFDYVTALTASFHAVTGENVSLDDDQDVNGLFADPESPGHGFNFVAHEAGFTVYYYGHTATGERLWLISELLVTDLEIWKPIELKMYEVADGVFGSPQAEPTFWGTLNITLSDCKSGGATLNGLDGQLWMDTVKIVGLKNSTCI